MKKIFRLFICLQLAFNVNQFAHAQVIVNSICVPPLDTNTAYTSQYHVQALAGLIDLENVIHYGFSQCSNPPETLYVSQTDSFTSTVAGDLSMNSGQSFTYIVAPCQTKVQMQYAGINNDTSYYNTEMIVLDIIGGTLPAGYRVRESPTLHSYGFTKITPVGNQYLISSYFNIYIELSPNYGASWIPADSIAHVELHAINTGVSETQFAEETIHATPNPFADEALIQFKVAAAGKASLKIYDASGKELSTPFNAFASPGNNYSVVFNGENLTPGIYIYKLETMSKISVGKIILVR